MFKLSAHAARRLSTARVGLDPLEVTKYFMREANNARRVSYEEACNIAIISEKDEKAHYYVLPDPIMNGCDIVLLVKNNVVVTVFTELTQELYGVDVTQVDGVRVIKSMEGTTYEDSANWVRKLRQSRRKATYARQGNGR